MYTTFSSHATPGRAVRRRAGVCVSLALGLVLAAQLAAPARATVEDPTNSLDPYGPNLAIWTELWRTDLGIEVRVVVLSLRDQRLERIARRIFDLHGLAHAAPNGGLLLLIDSEGTGARIEVSRELSTLYPERLLADLAHHQLVPYASYGELGMGVADVLHFMKDLAYEQLARSSLARPRTLSPPRATQLGEWLARHRDRPSAQVELPDVPDDLELKRRIPASERARYAPSFLVSESVDAYVRSLDALVGDPTLELFTPGSQVMRAHYPLAPYEAWRRRDALIASKPWTVSTEGGRAVVDSARPAQGFVPVLLHQIDGAWRIDEVEIYKNLFYGPDGAPTLVNDENPYMFGLSHLRSVASPRHLSALELDAPPAEAIARLEAEIAQGPSAGSHFELAEILLRNCFSASAAFRHYRQAARLAPDDARIARRTAERAVYLGFPEVAIPILERMGEDAYALLAEAHAEARHFERAEHYYRLELERDPASKVARAGLANVRRAQRP